MIALFEGVVGECEDDGEEPEEQSRISERNLQGDGAK